MSHYYKTRLYEDPFTVQKALTIPHRIEQWIKKQSTFAYNPDEGFFSKEFEGVYLRPMPTDSEKMIPLELTLKPIGHESMTTKKARLELFYMKSHSRSDRFTDLHLFESVLENDAHERFDAFIKVFFETLRFNYNGNWFIQDRDLNSSRIF